MRTHGTVFFSQVPLVSERYVRRRVLASAKNRVDRHVAAGVLLSAPWHMPLARAHAMSARSMNGMYYYVHAFIYMHPGMRRGSQPRVPENRRFRRSLERGAETPHACHDACLACAQHYSCHERCACSMPWCVRAHGARTRLWWFHTGFA